MQNTEYQCFKNVLKEAFELCFTTPYKAKYDDIELEKFRKDLAKESASIGLTTLKNHRKLKEDDNLPHTSTLNIYCMYCVKKGSKKITNEEWKMVLEEHKRNVEKEEKTDDQEATKEERKNKNKMSTNVWYTPKKYGFFNIWRQEDEGTLFIDYTEKQLKFESEETASLIIHQEEMTQVIHTKMPGDLSNNWVKVTYKGKKEAWFQDRPPKPNSLKRTRGMDNLLGGSEDLYKAIYKLFKMD